ncbi:hypothetical protein OPV22_034761 [Ensete ventricosum]|uniref:CRC domain-containing protein n=1 Tax=Ensete ventricosum TaxID=4639 RepID=A0AAV8PJP2_ENSVE|nr:hypothetical protein OPV22_034761 [Ensete ventricosum]
MRKCRRQPRAAAAGIASARPVAKCRCERCCSRHCECPSRRQVQMCRIQARALLQQAALRVPVPSPSADLQNSGASAAAAASIASARPVPKCRFAEFRRERCCSSQHCECPSRPQFGPICIIHARALLQQAALRVPVPSPIWAHLHNSCASAAAAASIASARPVPKCRFAEFMRERCCSSQHSECPSRPQVQICRIQARALLQQAALRVPVPSPSADFQISATSATSAAAAV